MKKFNQITLWTAVLTPMDHSGRVDYLSFEKLLRMQEEAGNGVVVLGSTGEALNLNQNEREDIVRFTMQKKLQVPVMVGVPGHHLEGTLEWLKLTESMAVDCYLMVTPIYAKPGEDGQRRWFEQIMNAVTKPCMLYNVPSRTGISLNINTVKSLASHPNFWAIKEASGSEETFSHYKDALPQQKIFSGDDALMVEFAKRGASGLVSVASNLWPKACATYVELALQGKTQGLLPLWADATNALFQAANPIPAKALANHLHLINSPVVRAPLSQWDYLHLAELISFHHAIQDWAKTQGIDAKESPWAQA